MIWKLHSVDGVLSHLYKVVSGGVTINVGLGILAPIPNMLEMCSKSLLVDVGSEGAILGAH